jgi:hypothetical protein
VYSHIYRRNERKIAASVAVLCNQIRWFGSNTNNEMGAAEEERTRGSRIAFLDVYVAFYNIRLVV